MEDITIVEGENYNGWTDTGEYERILTSITSCDSIVTTQLTVKQLQYHSVHLEKGWNIISTWLVPEKDNIENIFAKLRQENLLVAVLDKAGNTYIKEGDEWINYIGSITTSEGYIVKVLSAVELEISGYPVKLPINIPLKKGWNIISFPYNGAVDALSVLQPLIESGILEKVQDEKGNSVENWGGSRGWINGIGNFEVGEGYLVQVNQNGILPILNDYEKSGYLVTNKLPLTYYNVDHVGNGSGHMNINILNIVQSGMKAGVELATFDGQICVGAIKLSENNIITNAVSIPDSVSDENVPNGFSEGNPVEIKLCLKKNEEIAFAPRGVEGKMIFQKHKNIFINLLNENKTSNNSFQSPINIKIFPNPANEKITLMFSQPPDPGTQIILTDLTGKQLMLHEVKTTREALNVNSFPAGIYLLKVKSGNNNTTRKVIIK